MSISSHAASAREAARGPGGKFGEQPHTEPDISLAPERAGRSSPEIVGTAAEAQRHVESIVASERTAVVISRTQQQLIETGDGNTEAIAGPSHLEVYSCDTHDEVRDLVGQETTSEVDRSTERILEDSETQMDGSFESVCVDVHRPNPPRLTPAQAQALQELAGRFEDGYDEARIDHALSRLSDERTELVCVWQGEDEHGACRDSEIIGRVDRGAWRPLDPDAFEYLHGRGARPPAHLLSTDRYADQDVAVHRGPTPYNAVSQPAA